MNTKQKQKIIFEEVEYSRIVRGLILSSTGSLGKVDINGVRYRVKQDISTKTWQVIDRDPYHRKRAQISAQTRKAVFERDNHMCLMCGGVEHLQLDHLEPHIAGGSSDIENLQTLCRSCNGAKGAFSSFSSKQRSNYGRSWYPSGERNLASRLIQTLLRHGYTSKQIAEEASLPQQSVTKLAKKAHGSYDSVKKIEEFSARVMPELRVLVEFVANNRVTQVLQEADQERGFSVSPEQMRAWGYSEERVQWILKNQEITKTLRQQGVSEQEIAEKMPMMNPTTKEEMQSMGFARSHAERWGNMNKTKF